MQSPIKYLLIVTISTVVFLAPFFFFNLYFDPLWYVSGNQHENINYPFNERLSRTNQFLRTYENKQLNCVMFGSSRATLFNEDFLDKKYKCFNYAFSGGVAAEYIEFLTWIKNRGIIPKYIIVAIDDRNFVKREISVPDYIYKDGMPPNIFTTYLSLDALFMSIKLLNHKKIMPRMYNEKFMGIVEDPPEYKPKLKDKKKTKLNHEIIEQYKLLLNIFPESVYIAYVSPISPWRLKNKIEYERSFYLNSVYTISQYFNSLYDFSIPGNITGNPDNSYDDNHYLPFIYKKIADVITNKEEGFGVNIKEMTKDEYLELHDSALNRFFKNHE